jgi:hypothetical protein
MVVHNCHHHAATTFKRVLDGLETPLLVGLTATPERADTKSLYTVFDKIVFRYSLMQGVGAGYLCDLRSKQVSIRGLHLEAVKERGKDYDTGALGDALEAADAPALTAAAVVEHAAGRKSLVFTPTVSTAQLTTMELRARGVRAAWLSGETKIEDRRKVLGEFSEGKYQALVNCAVLLEGYDEPSIDCVVIARPTKSRVMYQQMIGRGTRTYFGKSDCLILDLVGAEESAGLVTFESLFGLSQRSAEGGLLDLLRSVQGQTEAGIVGAQIEVVERGRLHWVEDRRPEGSRWLLSAGVETLILSRLEGKWGIRVAPRGDAGSRLIYRDLTLDYAQGVAEDYVRAAGAWNLADPGASWRGIPASIKQIDLLKKLGVEYKIGISKGEASDLLSRRFMSRR